MCELSESPINAQFMTNVAGGIEFNADQPGAPIEVPKGGRFADMAALKGDKEIGDKINMIISSPSRNQAPLFGQCHRRNS